MSTCDEPQRTRIRGGCASCARRSPPKPPHLVVQVRSSNVESNTSATLSSLLSADHNRPGRLVGLDWVPWDMLLAFTSLHHMLDTTTHISRHMQNTLQHNTPSTDQGHIHHTSAHQTSGSAASNTTHLSSFVTEPRCSLMSADNVMRDFPSTV